MTEQNHDVLLIEWIRKETTELMEDRPTPFSFGDIQREVQAKATQTIAFTLTNYAKMFQAMETE